METRSYTERSNARRAARAFGVDPAMIKETEDGFTFDLAKAETPTPLKQAINAAVDPDSVADNLSNSDPNAAGDDLDIPEFLRRPAPTAEERTALHSSDRKLVMPKDKPRAADTTKKPKGQTAGGDKTATLLAMLKKGATVEAMTSALGWLPHTLRARISRLHKPKSKGGEGMKIERNRKDGVTSYKIVA